MSAHAGNPAAGKYPIAAAAMGLLLAGSLLPTPLFELYHRVLGLTPAEISLVFAVYAGSLIPSLLFLGGISDSIGRRRTLLLAFVGMALGALIFAFADGLVLLLIARVVQGIAMGIGTGAGAAAIREWMHEADRDRAGEVTVVAVSAGSAFGALLGGTLAQYGPHPQSLPFFVYIALLGCVAIAVASVPSCPHLHPTTNSAVLTVPPPIRRPFFVASAQAFIGWSTLAIFVALVPSFLARSLDAHNLLVGAAVISGLQVGSVVATLTGHRLPSRIAIVTALVALGAGLWLLIVGVAAHAYLLIAVAVLVAGAGGGLAYTVGLNIIGAISPPDHRAETLSAFLVACYLGFSVPALGVGIAANWFGLSASFFGAAIVLGVIALSIIAFTTDRNLQVATNL